MLAFPDCPSAGRHHSGLASSASGVVASSWKMEGLLGAASPGAVVYPMKPSAPLQCRATRSASSSVSGHATASNRVRAQAAPSATGVSVTAAAAAALAAPPSEAHRVLRRDGHAAGVLDSPEGALSADGGALASADDHRAYRHTALGSSGGEQLGEEGFQGEECREQVAGLKAGVWPSPLSLPGQAEVSAAQEDSRSERASGSSSDSVERPQKAKSASPRRQAKKAQEPRAKQVAEDRWRRDGPRTKLLQRIKYEEERSRDGRGRGRQDKSHTSAARALTFCLRGVQTVEEVGNVVRGAESALSMPVISSCLSKLGFEGHSGAAISLLQWLRKESSGAASAGASQSSQSAPATAKGVAETHQQTAAPDVSTAKTGDAAIECEMERGGEPAGPPVQQGRQALRAPNVFTYNAALGALRTNREWKRMDSVLAWMQEDGVPMDTVTLNTFLAAYLDLGKEDVAWDVLAKATAAQEPCPDLFTVRTMVPALLSWKPEGVALGGAAGVQGAHGQLPPSRATAEGRASEDAMSADTMMPKGYQEWGTQWRRLQLLLGIFKGVSEALGLRQEESRLVRDSDRDGGAPQSTDEALANKAGAEVAHGPVPPMAGAFASSSSSLPAAPADSAATGGLACASHGNEPALPELPLQAGDSDPAADSPIGTPGRRGAGRSQVAQGPRHRRGRQRQQQQEVEACLRVACSQMVRSVVLLHEQHCQHDLAFSGPLGPQPPSQLAPGGAVPTAAEQGKGESAGPGAEAKAEEAVSPNLPTPDAGSITSSSHHAAAESSSPSVPEPGEGTQSQSAESETRVGTPQPRAVPAEDPRSRLWAGAAVAVAESMAGAGVRRDGSTYYWLLKALCLSPVAHQKRIRALYHEMREQRYLPQLGLCHSVMEALGTAKRWWAALEVYEDMGRQGPQPTAETQALLRAHFHVLLNAARKRRIWKWALLLLQRMQAAGVAPDRRAWASALVTCATANATEAAVDVFRGMLEAGHVAGPREYGALLSALEKGRQWAQADEVWVHMARLGVPPGLQNYTTMIAALGAQGLYGRAVALFEDMRTNVGLAPDAAGYNALISACAIAGEGTRAVAWIQKMEEAGVQPNEVSYEQAAVALCNQGQWQAARVLLSTMGLKGLQLSQRCESILQHCTHHLVHTGPAHELDAADEPNAGEVPPTDGDALPLGGSKELLAA